MNVQQGYLDLIWAAESRSLIKHDSTTPLLSAVEQERLIRGDYAEDFHRFLARRSATMNHKVGLYFEVLVEFLLTNVIKGRMIHCGQQVIENGRTVGEVDFIFEHDSQIWHLEAAVKFYLFDSEACSIRDRLVGPNSSDSFESKMERMFDVQLPLSQTYFPEVTKRLAFVKGVIFYPHHLFSPGMSSRSVVIDHLDLPDRLNGWHQKGVWCRASDCHSFLQQRKTDQYVLRRKPSWLSDLCRPLDSTDLFSGSQMTTYLGQHFRNSKRPLMLSALSKVEGCFQEVDRVFVVDDTWPWS